MIAAVALSTCMKSRVSISLPSNRKLLIKTVPTGKSHLPSSAEPEGTPIGEVHSALIPASPSQFLT